MNSSPSPQSRPLPVANAAEAFAVVSPVIERILRQVDTILSEAPTIQRTVDQKHDGVRAQCGPTKILTERSNADGAECYRVHCDRSQEIGVRLLTFRVPGQGVHNVVVYEDGKMIFGIQRSQPDAKFVPYFVLQAKSPEQVTVLLEGAERCLTTVISDYAGARLPQRPKATEQR